MNEVCTILIVDNDNANLMLLDAIISTYFKHIVIVHSNSAQGALGMMKAIKIDIVLSDIKMPNMDGYELTRKIKNNSATKDILILLVSTLDRGSESEVKIYEEGAIGFISKPINSKLFVAQLKSCLRIVESQRRLKKGNSTFLVNI